MHNHFKDIKINEDQYQAVDKISSFLKSDSNIFILRGYAGTGKTTLIKGVVNFLSKNNKHFNVMAPTGRAAKVLRDKTGHGGTIHSNIYKLDAVKSINSESKEVAKHSISRTSIYYLF